MDDSRGRVTFGVVKLIAVPMILKTSHIDKFVKDILSTERKIVLFNSGPVLSPTMAEPDSEEEQAGVVSLLQDNIAKHQGANCVVRKV